MTVTHSSLVVLMMTIFTQVKAVKRVAKRIPMESGGCVGEKKNQYFTARKHQYYWGESDFSDLLVRNTICEK